VVEIVCQGETRFTLRAAGEDDDPLAVLSHTTLSQILEFVEQVPFDAIRFILEAARLNDALSRRAKRKVGAAHWRDAANSARVDGWRRIWVQTLLSAPARPRMPEWAAHAAGHEQLRFGQSGDHRHHAGCGGG
jgi:hypothetical protein